MEKENIEIKIKNIGTFSLEKGESVLSMLRKEQLLCFTNCGGKGTCGRCRIRYIQGATLPMPGDRRRFTPQKLRDGYRLACLSKPQGNCELELMFSNTEEFILTDSVIMKSDKLESKDIRKDYIVITDLGTTTIVMQLFEITSGILVDTYTALNPQRQYGADVINRMQFAKDGKAGELSILAMTIINHGLDNWNKYHIKLLVIACNTVMTHLLLQYDVTMLSASPFQPFTLDKIETVMHEIQTIVLPGISAFVGGDIVAGILTCNELMKKDKIKTALFVDLGTNGEMAIIGENKILCTACAAGPAFEGGATVSVPGSDVIAAVDDLLENHWIDENGLLCETYFEQGVTIAGIHITQQDIRALQMAKAAVFAGIQLLIESYGVTVNEIEKVYLAGGFGYKLNVQAAIRIGVLPSQLKDKTVAVGNTSLAGAYLYGCEYLKYSLNPKPLTDKEDNFKDILKDIQEKSNSINLAQQKQFNDLYMKALLLKEKEI